MHIKHQIHHMNSRTRTKTNNISQKFKNSTFRLLFILIAFLFNLGECKIKYDHQKYDGLNDVIDNYYKTRNSENLENYSLDVAIKLKREYADELVSDLFATSHGIEKVSRVCIILAFSFFSLNKYLNLLNSM